MSYRDAKIRICPKCKKNVIECECQNQEYEKQQKNNQQK